MDAGERIELTDREMAIAKQAARIAVQELTDDFYKSVGKTVVTRVLIWIGMIALGYAGAKGWVSWKGPG